MKNRILLIEDELATRFGFVRYFAKEGYEVGEARDLAEAASLFAAERFDAVILDINLPDGNGIHFIDAIREMTRPYRSLSLPAPPTFRWQWRPCSAAPTIF